MRELFAGLSGAVLAIGVYVGVLSGGSDGSPPPSAPAPFDVAAFCVTADSVVLGAAVDLDSRERIATKGREQVNWKDDGVNRLATRYYIVDGTQFDEPVEVFDNAVACMRGAR